MRRLVLGEGGVARTVLGVVSTWPGDVHAIVDETVGTTTIPEDATVVRGDPTDPSGYPEMADTVFATAGDGERVDEITTRAVEAFDDALLVACCPPEATRETRTAVAERVDRLVDGSGVVGDAVRDAAVGPAGARVRRLQRVLRRLDGPLAVVTHDNPDPDAIGSALALAHIADAAGVAATPCYYGKISHQENRALVNLLDLDLRRLDDGEDPREEFAGIAVVDHSRPGVNDGLDPETTVDIVIDHHPPRAPVEARFVDLRHDVGATATLLTDYLRTLRLDPPADIATALLYGIRIDTRDLTRETASDDFEAAAFLHTRADHGVLERVESPSMGAELLDTLASAIRNRDVRGDILVSGVGEIADPDAVAQAADYLLGMEETNVAVVHGFLDGTVHVSGRARGCRVDLGETFRDALGAIGSAGGHANMAGGQLPLGILADATDADDLAGVVDELVATRFFETLETPPRTPDDGVTDDLTFVVPLDDE